MYRTKKATKFTNIQVGIISSDLVQELTDSRSEQVCGGAIMTPDTTGGNDSTMTPATQGNSSALPLNVGYKPINGIADYGQLGLNPFYPTLPPSKLPRIGSLDPSTRTSPKNVITITIPLPEF